jgi:hypothetical protein
MSLAIAADDDGGRTIEAEVEFNDSGGQTDLVMENSHVFVGGKFGGGEHAMGGNPRALCDGPSGIERFVEIGGGKDGESSVAAEQWLGFRAEGGGEEEGCDEECEFHGEPASVITSLPWEVTGTTRAPSTRIS